MGGPGSGRRPWKPRKRGEQVLVQGADGHFHYVTVERTQTARERRREAASPRQQVAAAALVSGAAETVREAMREAGYQNPDGGSRAGIKRLAADVADEVGLTLRRACETVAKALDAKKILVTREGCIGQPDTDAQLRAAEIGLRVHGVGQEYNVGGGNITVVEMIYSPQQVVVTARRNEELTEQ